MIRNPMSPKEMWKQALMSILIGATISFLTIVFQGIIDLLNAIPTEAPGPVVGVIRYIVWLASSRNV